MLRTQQQPQAQAMSERELKFHIPASSRSILLQALSCLSPTEHKLQACYYDTPERELAKARTALRLRNEDGLWVQTAKAAGQDAVSRLEFNHPRTDNTLNIDALKNTPLYKTLAPLEQRLCPTYEVDVTRLALQIKHRDSVIELAHDQGTLRSGITALDIHELELELISGHIADLFHVAEQWQQKYNLVLELRSKAERGDTLVALTQKDNSTPDLSAMIRIRRPGNIAYQPSHDLRSAFQVCVDDCLQQVIRNTASLAGIDSELATPAQHIALVHQLRVGIRRLRSCWKLFRPWIDADSSADAAELRRYFSLFGEGRDQDVIRHEVTPRLIKAGMPHPILPANDASDPQRSRSLAASAGLQTVLLRLLAQSLNTPADTSKGKESKKQEHDSVTRPMLRRLNKWLNLIMQTGCQFNNLPAEERHELRKKIKRLRYGLEFSQSLLLETAYPRETRSLLQSIQRTLGELNDLYTTEDFYQALTSQQAAAWFAIGWTRATQDALSQRITTLFELLTKAPMLKA